MSFAVLSRVRKTLSFRLTGYSTLFTLSGLSLVVVVYGLLSFSLRHRDQAAIRLTLTEYADEYRRGALEGIKEKIVREESQTGALPFFIRLVGTDHHTLFLNRPWKWKPFDVDQLITQIDNATESWVVLPAQDDDEEMLEVASVRLPDGVLLQVGLSSEERDELLEKFRGILVVVMIPVVLIGLAGGAFLALRALRPLRGFLSLLRSIVTTGALNARAPVTGAGDELDELSLLFNSMLDRIGLLITGMRNTLDHVAHDLRTPMTRLRGMAELALQTEHSEAALREALANCIEESDRILAMLNTLMDISEAEHGAMKLAKEPLNVQALITQTVELYRDVAEEKALQLSTSVPSELSIHADRNRMQQVLANLLDNAIKYTPRGGQVSLAARSHQQHVVITVTDTGIGIPSEDLSKIWDRLYRGDTSRSQRGLGLGLSLVKAIVQAHQGVVEVSNNGDRGSCFALYLPIETPA
jgi:signal transduction histidine kinase